MAMVSGRGGKPMFTMTDEDLRPIRRASKDDTTAVRAIVRDYRASGGARILVVGSDTNGMTEELVCHRRRWPAPTVADWARSLLASLSDDASNDE